LSVGNLSLDQDSNDNDVRIVNFATSKNLVVKSTMFPTETFINTHGSPRWKDSQPDWSRINREEMAFEYTSCTKFLGSWMWYR